MNGVMFHLNRVGLAFILVKCPIFVCAKAYNDEHYSEKVSLNSRMSRSKYWKSFTGYFFSNFLKAFAQASYCEFASIISSTGTWVLISVPRGIYETLNA